MDNERGLRSVNDIILLRFFFFSSAACSRGRRLCRRLFVFSFERFFLVKLFLEQKFLEQKWSKKEQNLLEKSSSFISSDYGNDGITCDDARMMMMMMK